MAAIKDPLVIEITDEAYKQNSVYRPWNDTKTNGLAAMSDASFTQLRGLNTYASVKRGLRTASGITE